jgi:hypothetical protein
MIQDASTSQVTPDRHYAAPRNPVLESPDLQDIVQSAQIGSPEGYLVYGEASWSPRDATKLGGGSMHAFANGMVFLPNGPLAREQNIALFKEAALLLTTPLLFGEGNAIVDTIRDEALGAVLIREKKAQAILGERLSDPHLFVLPWVDIVETADAITRGKGIWPNWVRRTVVRAVDDEGGERGFTFTRQAPRNDRVKTEVSLAYRLFALRAGAERRAMGINVASVLSGYNDRAMTRLASLGIEIEGPFLNDTTLRRAIRKADEAGRIDDLPLVKLRDAIAPDDPAIQIEADDAAPAFSVAAKRWLAYVDPVLSAYRLEPHLANLIELIEYLAAGGTDDAYLGTIKAADHATNLAPLGV